MAKPVDDIYSEYYVRGSKRAKSVSTVKQRAVVFLMILLSFAAVLVLIFFFSDGLSFSRGTAEAVIKEQKLYALMLYSSDTEAERLDAAAQMKNAGGAGYIRENAVYAACYRSEQDIDAVIAGLTEDSGFTPVKKTLTLPKATVKAALGAKGITALTEKIEYFLKIYDNLYSLSVRLDSAEIGASDAKKSLETYYTLTLSASAEFTALTKDLDGLSFIRIKAAYAAALNSLEELCTAADGKLSSEIKYIYIDIVFDYFDLLSELSA